MFQRIGFLLWIWVSLQAAPADPATLQLRIIEGDGAIYSLGSRSTRGIGIEVTDDTGKLVEGAVVSFRLPEDGPSGLFSNKSKTEISTTGRDGRAAVWGMQWNRIPGSFEVRITVTKGDARAGTVCSQSLAMNSEPSAKRVGGSHSHKWLWASLGVAGGAGAAVMLAGRVGAGSSPGTSAVSVTTIGSPTISLGRQ